MNDLVTATTALTIANKLLGKTAEEIATDLANTYKVGRDKIIAAFVRKVNNPDKNWQTNLRVTKDVISNGSFSDESICAEYFGGILASSRSVDGKDDHGVYYTDIIKSLSSQQLLLHYIFYNSINKLWINLPEQETRPNPGMGSELGKYHVWFSTMQIEKCGVDIDKDIIALVSKGLIGDSYEALTIDLKDQIKFPYTKIQPTTLGIQLYAVAHNKLNVWRSLTSANFGDFSDIKLPECSAFTKEELLKMLKLDKLIT